MRYSMLALVLFTMAGCTGEAARTPDVTLARLDIPAHAYVDPQPVGSYPSSKQRIQRWIDAGQTDSIRAHGWDIWQSITATVRDTMPTWQTFYSGHELFDLLSQPTDAARPRNVLLPLERPRQFAHHVRRVRVGASRLGIPVDTFERVFAFNRFSRSTSQYIWKHEINRVSTLYFTNLVQDSIRMPIAQRQILVSADSVDPLSFVTKVVFQFISGTAPSAIPYWAGYDSQHSTDSLHPPPRMWKQAVAVDPTGKLQPGDSVFLPFNQQPATWLKVVPLASFYHIKVTAADSANLTQFGSENGDDLGFNSDTSQAAVLAAARPGNYGLMLAMHVTGKEIANWTWQSYWWSPFPNDSLGNDRPASIPAPWNNYVMTTVYSMLATSGQPNIAFNPYLETSLAGKTEVDSVPWTGVVTNCMSCHRRAAIGYWGNDSASFTAALPIYGPAALVNPGDSIIFTVPAAGVPVRIQTLKTDFLWSVAIRAGLQPVSQSTRTALKARAKAAAAPKK